MNNITSLKIRNVQGTFKITKCKEKIKKIDIFLFSDKIILFPSFSLSFTVNLTPLVGRI